MKRIQLPLLCLSIFGTLLGEGTTLTTENLKKHTRAIELQEAGDNSSARADLDRQWLLEDLDGAYSKGNTIHFAQILSDRYYQANDKDAWCTLATMGTPAMRSDNCEDENYEFTSEQARKGLLAVAIELSQKKSQKKRNDAAILVQNMKRLPGFNVLSYSYNEQFYINYLEARRAKACRELAEEKRYLGIAIFHGSFPAKLVPSRDSCGPVPQDMLKKCVDRKNDLLKDLV